MTAGLRARTWGTGVRGPIGALVLAVAVLALVLATGLAARFVLRERARDQAGAAAAQAAQSSVATVLSYDHANLEADLGRSRALLTDSFAGTFDDIVAEQVRPLAEREQYVRTAQVPTAAVIDADVDQAEILLIVNQLTRARGHDDVLSSDAVQVSMRRSGNTWLVAALDPL